MTATSQNGFRAVAASDALLHIWEIPSKTGTFQLKLRNGSAGFILAHLALWFSEDIEDVTQGPVLDDWGYAFRPIRGQSSGLSNHASGTAVDLDATRHGLAREHTYTKAQLDAIHKRLKFYGGVVRFGGDYKGRVDPMHFEINKSMAACERLAKKLLDTPRGKRLDAANPGQKNVIYS